MRSSTQAVKPPRHWGALALCLLGLLLVGSPRPTLNRNSTPGTRHTALHASHPALIASYGKLPLSFEANQGQSDNRVKFLSRGPGYALFLTGTEAVLALSQPQNTQRDAPMERWRPAGPGGLSQLLTSPGAGKMPALHKQAVLRMRLVGANPNAEARGLEELRGKSNYFIGNDPSKWRTNVPTYGKVEYRDVYPGINLVHYGNQRQLEYDFVVAPGADPRAIRFEVGGADRIEIDSAGDLVLHVAGGEVRQHKPIVYQQIADHRRDIPGRFVFSGQQQVGFEVGSYDASQPLVVDPVLVYSTYLGGSGDDQAGGGAVDSAGNAYVTGYTYSTNFPTASPLQAAFGGTTDAFVAKLNATGSALVYSTYLGGNGSDYGYGIAVDSAGNAYVTGQTNSTNFPTVSPLQPSYGGGGWDAFVTKLNPAGSALVYSTYLGGSGQDMGYSIAVDSLGNAYVTGQTQSLNFPTASPLWAAHGGGMFDPFVAKLNAAGSALVYSTYLGGSGEDWGSGIAVDSAGSAYVTGGTYSTNFPTASPLQSAFSGNYDAFVTKLSVSGSALVYSTYLGGSASNMGKAIAVDSSGNAYVTGFTSSANFPTANAVQAAYGGGGDAFVLKLNPSGSTLLYSTHLGGSDSDLGSGIAVDSSGNAYVTGYTWSTNFPTATPLQAVYGGGYDAFVTKLNAAGSALLYSTYLGGSGREDGYGIAVDSAGNAYVTGSTASTNFPTANAFQPVFGGGSYDAFIAKIGTGVAACTYSIAPATQAFTASAASGSVAVTAASGCTWTATSNAAWITITSGSSGSGNGTVGYSVTANTNTSSRTGTLTIAGQTFTVNQAGATCSYAIAPTSASAPAGGTTGSVTVTAPTGCTWTAASTASWITISSGASGSGNGTVSYSVAANPSASSRTGTLTIAGQAFTVNQAAATCSYAIAPASASAPAAGGMGSVTVTAASGCTWTAASNASWITITSGSSGSGNGTVNYTVAANSSAGSRTGTLTIAGQTFTVAQAAAATLNVSPATLSFTAQRGGANPPVQGLQVTASDASSIPWTATSSAAWLSVSPASGNTPANVSVSVNITGLAAGSYTGQVSLASGGGTPATVSVSLNVSETPAVIAASPASLQFTTSAGINPASQNLTVSNLGGGTLSWLATVGYTTTSGWLSISPPGGNAPTTATVSVDVVTPVLPAGTYRGQILVFALSGATNSPLSVPVTLVVTSPSQLAVSPQFLSFQATQGSSAAVTQALSITNAGSGALTWTASATTSNGGDWLRLSATQGAAPAAITVSANPAGLPAGVYLGSIRIADVAGGGSITVIVALTVNPPATTILLSQSDFVFTTVESSASPLRQTLRILNIGQGTLAWRLLATIPSGGNWLSVEQASGSSTTDPATAAAIGVLVSPAGLAAGNYYGLLIASSSGATNSPQLASVHLRVLPSTSAPKPSVLPSGFIFAASDGGASPAPQVFSVQNLGGGALPFKASVSTADGSPWLSVSPSQSNAPATMTVQVNSANLRAGVYRGSIALDFPAGLTQELSVVLVITPFGVTPSAFNGPEERAAGCTPTELQAVSTYLPNNFLSLVGWPVPIMVRVVDNCNNAVTGATVVASFLGAESAPLVLKALRDGLYTGTWVPLSNARVRVSIKALNPPLKEATVEMLSQPADFTANLPLINPDGVVNGASFDPRTPVAPGSIISLFGRNLVPQPIPATGVPLPTNLGGLAMKIGDRDAPLFYANNGQVNAQVPVELASNTATSVVLTMNGKVSPPEPLLLAPVQPGIFTYDDGGTQHAAALDEKNALVGKANPAVRGTIIQVYATGLGPTDPAAKTGEPAPASPPALLKPEIQLTATIGGVPAEIQFKGLAPGYVGLYQVNLKVPSGLPSGDVPLVLTANGLPSKEAMLPLK